MTTSDQELTYVTGGNVGNGTAGKRLLNRRMKQLFLPPLLLHAAWWAFAIISTCLRGPVHVAYFTLVIGVYASVSLLLVFRAALK